MAVDLETLRRIALALPGVEEGRAYGTTAFRIGRNFLARLRDDDTVLVLRLGIDERNMLLEAEPAIFFLTEHYRDYPSVLVRLGACEPERLARLLERSWRDVAPARLRALKPLQP